MDNVNTQRSSRAIPPKERTRHAAPALLWVFDSLPASDAGVAGAAHVTVDLKLVSLFTSLLAIPLARQSRFYALLLAGLQVVGVTLDFLNNVLLLYLPLEPAQRIFQRLAFLYANLCQKIHLQTCQRAIPMILERLVRGSRGGGLSFKFPFRRGKLRRKRPEPAGPGLEQLSAQAAWPGITWPGCAPCRKLDPETLRP